MNVFISFPYNYVNEADFDASAIKALEKDLQLLLFRIKYEPEAVAFFENENKIAFLDALDLQGECIGIASKSMIIQTWLREIDATVCTYNTKAVFYKWEIDAENITNDFTTILKSAAESMLKGGKTIVLNINHYFTTQTPISIFKDDRNNTDLPKFVKIEIINNFKDLDEWLVKNHEKREYNFGDTRHIETHPNYRTGKSPLLGGLGGQKNAEKLLSNALCDKEGKDLYKYDATNECYIWFEDERSMNGYHGYHLVKPSSHERDKGKNGERKLPELAKEILQKRR